MSYPIPSSPPFGDSWGVFREWVFKAVGDFIHVMIPIWIPQELAHRGHAEQSSRERSLLPIAAFPIATPNGQQAVDIRAKCRSGGAFCRVILWETI